MRIKCFLLKESKFQMGDFKITQAVIVKIVISLVILVKKEKEKIMISHIQKAVMNFLFATFHQPFPPKTMHAIGIHARDTFFVLE